MLIHIIIQHLSRSINPYALPGELSTQGANLLFSMYVVKVVAYILEINKCWNYTGCA